MNRLFIKCTTWLHQILVMRLRTDASVWFKSAHCFMNSILAEEEFGKPITHMNSRNKIVLKCEEFMIMIVVKVDLL